MKHVTAGLLVFLPTLAFGGAFIFADGDNPDLILHPTGYTGSGGDLPVSVCILPSSESIPEIEIPVRNVINTWNRREPVSPNLFFGNNNNIDSNNKFDFESVLLHEVGHCVGLAHPNLATESGLPPADRDYTKAAMGSNDMFDIDPGLDGIKGSADDPRGDDINLHWFNVGINNPLLLTQPVDASTYSVSLDDLPDGDSFVANADRSVAAALGFADTEAVMNQGTFNNEAQRDLAVDDVATLGLGMSGLDRLQGTADDYQPRLEYAGVTSDCDITIEVTGSSFGFCSVGGVSLSSDHFRITSAVINLASSSQINWFFNQESNVQVIFSDGFESDD